MDRQQRLVEEMRQRFPEIMADPTAFLAHLNQNPEMTRHYYRLNRLRQGLSYEPRTEAEINHENQTVRQAQEAVVRNRPRQVVEFVNPWGNDIPYDEDAERRMLQSPLQSPRSSSPANSIAESFSDVGYDEDAEMRMLNAESPTSPAEMFELADLETFDPTDPLNF